MDGRMDALAVIFGNFKLDNIKTETLKIQNLFKEYEFFCTLNQNIVGQPGIVVPMLEFVSNSKNINLRLSRERIEIIKPFSVNDKGVKTDYDEVEFLECVKNIQKELLAHYKVNGNRISYVINSGKTKTEKINEVKGRVVSDYFYKSNESFEWGSRSAIKELFIIKDNEEEINVITSLNYNSDRIKIAIGNSAIDIYGLMYNIDINTSPNNMQTRIDAKFIDEFYEQAKKLADKIEETF
ncbi:MAG: hypothetical protein PHX04_01810 [Bacilli bacterium]|nr:hypothetical protein [Bacilli bacterium]